MLTKDERLDLSVGVAPKAGGVTLRLVPTVKPRYTFTDTGELESILDAAERRWPEIAERKALLLRLVQEAANELEADDDRTAAEERRERVRRALERVPALVDVDVLLSDDAWR